MRALEPEHTRLKVGKILAPPAQEQTTFGDERSAFGRGGEWSQMRIRQRVEGALERDGRGEEATVDS